MRAAERTVTLGRCEYDRLSGKFVQIGSHYRVALEVDVFAESFLSPETHCVVTVLVREHINHVRGLDFFLLCLAAVQADRKKSY